MPEQIADRLRIHAFLLHEIEYDSRIEIAAALAHGEAIECGKAHGGRDAFSFKHGAHAGPVAEMGDHNPSIRGSDDIRQDACDVFIRKAMEAVAPDTLFRESARQRKDAGHFRLR